MGGVPQLGINWKAQALWGIRTYFGFSSELRRAPVRFNISASAEARYVAGKPHSPQMEFIPALQLGTQYIALELFSLGASAFVGEKFTFGHGLSSKSFYWNLQFTLGFRF